MSTHCIHDQWREGSGALLESRDPVTGDVCWSGRAAGADEVDAAFKAARGAFEAWADTTLEQRSACIEAFAEQLRGDYETFAETISTETGKPIWEARTEVDAMLGKAPTSIAAHRERRAPMRIDMKDGHGYTRYKPHGVLAVFGPFNLPGHLPNGHIMPALLAGNTIVFKPSEQAPSVGARMMELWRRAGLPAGVINLVQGGRATGQHVVAHPQLDGLLFTGSFAAGRAINRALAGQPGKIVALEMGGNNPLIVHRTENVDAAAYHTVLSAFITAGVGPWLPYQML
ncbi:MAG: aldehyde dehydrogenase family protein, partial [Phycisphaeraceae bacterium]